MEDEFEYPYISPEEEDDSGYHDAYYMTSDGHRSYGYNPARSYDYQYRRQRRSHGIGWGAIIAIGLLCVMFASAAGVGAVYFFLRDRLTDTGVVAEATATTEIYTEAQTVQSEEAAPLSIANVDSGTQELSGEDIHALGKYQTVGIATSTDQYNVFGQASSTSVSGSGIILSEDGYILTNYHVIEAAYTSSYTITVILYNGETYTAAVTGVESDSDLAVLKIEAETMAGCEAAHGRACT